MPRCFLAKKSSSNNTTAIGLHWGPEDVTNNNHHQTTAAASEAATSQTTQATSASSIAQEASVNGGLHRGHHHGGQRGNELPTKVRVETLETRKYSVKLSGYFFTFRLGYPRLSARFRPQRPCYPFNSPFAHRQRIKPQFWPRQPLQPKRPLARPSRSPITIVVRKHLHFG
jgi:hypothetical protein